MLHDIFEEPHGKGSSRGKTSGEQAGPGKDTYRHWFFPGVGRHRVPGSSGVLLERFGGAAKVHTKGKTSVEQAGPGKGFPPIFSRWGAYPYRHWFFLGVGRRRMPRLSGGL